MTNPFDHHIIVSIGCMPDFNLLWFQLARLCTRFGPKSFYKDKCLLNKCCLDKLDHLIVVSIDYLPKFSLLGYVAVVSLKRYPILVPTHIHYKDIYHKLGLSCAKLRASLSG